ncbi:MAG: hypothetical protein V3W41_04490 [Planctomycetota bacterium]
MRRRLWLAIIVGIIVLGALSLKTMEGGNRLSRGLARLFGTEIADTPKSSVQNRAAEFSWTFEAQSNPASAPTVVEVYLEDELGQPCVEATLLVVGYSHLDSPNGDWIGLSGKGNDSTFRSDAKGNARLVGLAPGSHLVFARLGVKAALKKVIVRSAAKHQAASQSRYQSTPYLTTIELRHCKRITVELRDEQGQAVSDAIVVLSNPELDFGSGLSADDAFGGECAWAKTDLDGRATFFEAKATRRTEHPAARIRISMLRLGDVPPSKIFLMTSHDQVLSMQVPKTSAITFKGPQIDAPLRAGERESYFQAGEREFCLLAGANDDSVTDSMTSLLCQRAHYFPFERWTKIWSTRLPREGVRLRSFAPGDSVTTVLKTPRTKEQIQTFEVDTFAEKTLVFEPALQHAQIGFQIVDEDGQAIDVSNLRLTLDSNEGLGRRPFPSSSPNRRSFVISLPERLQGEIEIHGPKLYNATKDREVPDVLAVLPFQDLEAGKLRNLGKIVVKKPPVLIAGIAELIGGEPLRGATLYYETSDGHAPHPSWRRGRESTTTDQKGHFTLRAAHQPSLLYRLDLPLDLCSDESLAFEPGARNLRLKAIPTGRIQGRFLTSQGLIQDELAVACKRRGSDEDTRSARLRPNGCFDLPFLHPGVYEFQCHIDGFDAELIEGIVVESGQTLRPPALQEVMVGKGFRVAVVKVVDGLGKPLPGGFVRRQSFARDWSRTAQGNHHGIIRFAYRDAYPDKSITVSNLSGMAQWIDKTIESPSYPLVVTLYRAHTLTVDFQDRLPDLHQGCWTLEISRKASRYDQKLLLEQRARLLELRGEPPEFEPIVPKRRRLVYKSIPNGTHVTTFSLEEYGSWDLVLRHSGKEASRAFMVIGHIDVGLSQDLDVEVELSPKQTATLKSLIPK